MAIEIKNVTLDECKDIAEIEKSVIEVPWSLQNITSMLNNTRSVFRYATNGSEVLGYYSFSVIFDEAEINNIAVVKQHQGQGIANLLMHDMLALAEEKGCKKILLEVNQKNTIAQNLYIKFGFQQINIRKKYYNNTDDAIIMCKT